MRGTDQSLKTEDLPHLAYPCTQDAPEAVDFAPSSTVAPDFVYNDPHGAIRPGGAVRVFSKESGGLLVSGFMSSLVYQMLRDCLQYLMELHGSTDDFMAAAARFVDSTAVLAFFVGLLSDCVPLFGYNRKSYLLLGWAITCGVIVVMILVTQLTKGYPSLYAFIILAGFCSTGTMISYVATEIRLVELSQREPMQSRGYLVAIYTIFRISGQLIGRVLARLVLTAESVSSIRHGIIILFIVSCIAPASVYWMLYEPSATRPQLPLRQGFSYFKLLIQQQVVRNIVGFVCVYSAFSNVRMGEVDKALSVWSGVGARGQFAGRLGRDFLSIATVSFWSSYLVYKAWRKTFTLGPLFNAIPSALMGLVIASDAYRAGWFHFVFSSLGGVSDGIFRLAYLVPLVEICSFGSEGQTVGLVLSFDKLLAIIIRTASSEAFHGANFTVSDVMVRVDSPTARNRVMAMTILGNLLRLLALVALAWLPLQKMQAQEQRVYGTVSAAGASLVLSLFIVFFVGVLVLDISLFA